MIRSRLVVAAILTLVVAVLALGPASAQDADGRLIVEPAPRDADSVDLTVSVLPPGPRLIDPSAPSLAPSAFTVRQDGKRRPVAVTRLADDDLEVVLVIDPSALVDVAAIHGAVSELILGLPAGARVSVVSAGPEPAVVAPLGTDREAALASLRAIVGTGRADPDAAIALGVEELSGRPGARPTLVVFGADPEPDPATARQLAPGLRAAGVASYLVQLAPTSGIGTQPTPLPLGGGTRFDAAGRDPVAFVNTILARLLNQYRLRVGLADQIGATFLDLGVRTSETTLVAVTEVAPASDAGAGDLDAPPGPAADPASGSDDGLPMAWLAVAALALVAVVVFAAAAWSRRDRRPRPEAFAETGDRWPVVTAEPALVVAAPPWQAAADDAAAEDLADAELEEAGEPGVVPVASAIAGGDLGGDQVEGRAAVRQLLLSGARPVHEVWLAEGTDDAGIVELAAAASVPLRTVRPDVLEATARSGLAEGVIARAGPLPPVALDELAAEHEPTTIIALDGGVEPSQLGGLLRSAGSFGVDGVVLGGQGPEPSSPVVSATAEGAVEEVPIVAVDDLASEIGHLAEQGSVVVGVERHGASTLLEVDLDLEESAVVLVLDGAGVLGDQVRARCDAIVGVERSSEQGDDPQTLARLACLDLTRRRLPVEA